MRAPSTSVGAGVGGRSATSVPCLFLALFLSTSLLLTAAHSQQPAVTLSIDANSAPGSNTSLQYHLCGLGHRELVSVTTLQLSGGVHHLDEGPFCLLQNLENLTIQGQQTQPRTVIYCESETQTRRGIAFFNTSNLHLSHVDIVNCGGEVPSGLPGNVNNTFAYLGPLQKAAVIITHSTDVTLEDVSIDRCLGFGFLFINPLGETVIKAVSVTGTNNLTNCREKSYRRCPAGSGIVVVFTDTNITEELAKVGHNYTTSLFITNCFFVNNTNMISSNTVLELNRLINVAYKTERILMTGGLSLAVYTGQKSFLVEIKISRTSILYNEGNVPNFFVLYYNTIHVSTVRVEGLTVSDNKVKGSRSRGAGFMVIVALFFDYLHSLPQSQGGIHDLVEICSSNFSRNVAYSGGALTFYMTQQNVSDIRFLIRNTTFTGNIANFGSALYAFQFQSLVSSRGAYIYMEDITATGNTFPGATPREDFGIFVVSHGSNITLVGTEGNGSLFTTNNGSAFTAVRTNVVLRGKITFEDNHGYRGGALNLLDGSILFIHNSSDITFTRNTAFRRGGAVYANTFGSSVTATCAIQFFAEKQIGINHEDLQLLNICYLFKQQCSDCRKLHLWKPTLRLSVHSYHLHRPCQF